MEPIPFDIKNFKQNQNYCIEASAGTGKTYNIKKMVAKLILSEEEIPLSKILLVTYTEKAAGELRDRIRAELLEQLDAHSEPSQTEKRNRIADALAEIDSATIGTIHSFCQKTLHDFAYESDMPFALSMASEDSIADIVDRKIRDEWSRELKEIEANDIRDLMINAVKEYKKGMIFSPLIRSFQDWLEINPEFKKNWEIIKKFAQKGAEFISVNNKRNRNYPVQIIVDEIVKKNSSEFANCGTCFISADPPELHRAIQYFFSIKGENIIKIEKPENIVKFSFVADRVRDVYDAFQKRKQDNKQISFDDMILKVRDAIVSKESMLCEKLRRAYKYAIIDEFQDTNQTQWDIFKTVFLDSNSNHIIVVGDPKQSIYSFQGADLSVYLSAKNDVIHKGGIYAELNTNFRSTDEMVNACGQLFIKPFFEGPLKQNISFSPSNPSGCVLPVLLNGQKIKPIFLAKETTPEFFAKYAVSKIVDFTKIVVDKDQKRKTALQYYDKEAKGYQNLRLSKIAVLARTRSEMDGIEKEMAAAGIPFVRYKDSNLFKSREGFQWIALLKALNVPDFSGRNRGFLNAVLVSDFFRYSPQNVESEDFEKPNNSVIQWFAAWRSLLENFRYAELQERIYADTQIDRFLCDSSKLQQLAKVKQIGAYIFDYLYNNHVSLEDVIKHLDGLSIGSEDPDDDDGNLIARGSDFDAVQVMTIHASKGLQFPVVISVAGFKFAYQIPKSAYVNCDGVNKMIGFDNMSKERNLAVVLDEWRRLFYVDYTRAESILVLPFYKEKWDDKEEQFGFLKNALKQDGLENFVNSLDSLNDLGNSFQWKKQIADYLDENSFIERKTNPAPIAELNASLVGKSIFQHSYSSLAGKLKTENEVTAVDSDRRQNQDDSETVLPELKTRAAEIDPAPVRILASSAKTILENSLKHVFHYPRGSKLGNALHQTFERMDFEKIGSLENASAAVDDSDFRKLVEEQFKSQAFSIEDHADWVDQSAYYVWNTMNAVLPEIHGSVATGNKFSLKSLTEECRKAEMEFQMNALGFGENVLRNFCKGFMDLLFVRDNYYSILDWKSDVLENYGVGDNIVDGTAKKVDDEYAVQRVLYSYCLIQWLKSFRKFGSNEEEIFKKHFGGVYYVFFRGCRAGEPTGLYVQTWNSYAELAAAFENVKSLMAKM